MTQSQLTVIIVDDNEAVLCGLRRILRPKSRDWRLHFACGAEQALETMQRQPPDIVVTDIRMPHVDGAALLRRVRHEHPDTVRLVLSGHADREDIVRSVGPIHQFLSKPCDGPTLIATITRLGRLREVMRLPALRTIATGLECLPPIPEIHRRLLSELDRPDATAASIGAVLAEDVAMTAKMLQLVNSAFFGSVRPIYTAQDAVTRLGVNTVRGVVVAMRLFEQAVGAMTPTLSMNSMWRRAFAVSAACRLEAVALGLNEAAAANASLAGMLHEVGRLTLAVQTPARYTEAIAVATATGRSIASVEAECFGASQGELGGYLLGLWGFDQSLVDAVVYHARPAESTDNAPTCLTALHLAASSETIDRAWRVDRDEAYLERIGGRRKAA